MVQFLGQSIRCHTQQVFDRPHTNRFHHLSGSRPDRRGFFHLTGATQKESHTAGSFRGDSLLINRNGLRTTLARHLSFATRFAPGTTFIRVEVTDNSFSFAKPQVTFRGSGRRDGTFNHSMHQTSRSRFYGEATATVPSIVERASELPKSSPVDGLLTIDQASTASKSTSRFGTLKITHSIVNSFRSQPTELFNSRNP
jgi:hypothetical protein